MRVKSVRRPGVLGAMLMLLSPKVGLQVRRLIVALLTSADLLATRLVVADSAQRAALATADSERRLMKNLRFVSMVLLAACLMLVHRTTSAQVVTPLAGSGARGSVGGSSAKASFSYPQGLAVGPLGNVYVAGTSSPKIRKITQEGLVTTLAGGERSGCEHGIRTQARFFRPLTIPQQPGKEVKMTPTFTP